MKNKILIISLVFIIIFSSFNIATADLIDEVITMDINPEKIVIDEKNEFYILDLGGTYDLSAEGITFNFDSVRDFTVQLFTNGYSFEDGFYGIGHIQKWETNKVINFSISDYKMDSVSKLKIKENSWVEGQSAELKGTISFKTGKKIEDPNNPPDPPEPVEEFKLVSKNADIDNNTYKFAFNKDFTVIASDIEFVDSKGNAIAFTHSVTGKELLITPSSALGIESYKITVKKVTSSENEELTNVLPLSFRIQSNFYITSKDFSNFLLPETKELNLSFNKDIVVNTIEMGNLTVTKTVDGNKLKILLPSLVAETDYPLAIKVTSVDNEVLELSYNLSTKSITGNGSVDSILSPILGLFETAKVNGILIVIMAISIGVIFVVGKWLWGIAKEWLKKSK